MKEFVPLILWKNDNSLIEIIQNTFTVVDIFDFSFGSKEMKIKLDELYYPHKINDKDVRISSKNIKIIVVKIDNPDYVIMTRKEHKNKPLNKTIIDFKETTRKIYNYTYFHTADYLNECQDVFNVFKINKYKTNERFININNLLAIIHLRKAGWKENPQQITLKKVQDTPHYLYLTGCKEYYKSYTETKDINHDR